MSGINAYHKDKIIAACNRALESLKKDNEGNIFINQINQVETILQVAVHSEGTSVNLSNDEFSFIRHEFKS